MNMIFNYDSRREFFSQKLQRFCKPLKNYQKTYNIISKASVKVREKAVRNIYIPVPIYSEMGNANMEVKFAYVVCNLKPLA